MNRRRLFAAVIATPVVVLAPTQAAWAYFSAGPTSVNGSVKADSLGKPSISASRQVQLLPPKITDTITVTAAPTSGPTPMGYVVYRTTGILHTQVCTITTVPGHCMVSGTLLGDTYAVYSYLGSHWVSVTAATASTGILR